MKSFLITYSFQNGTPEAWHAQIAAFIAALDNDPELKGRIAYRCMKARSGNAYYHLATPQDDAAAAALQTRDWFMRYNEATRAVAGGEVTVTPLELIAQTA